MTRSRELVAGAALAGLGVLLALALLEGGVRWLHLAPDRFWVPDPILGIRLVPGRSGWWTQEDREFLTPIRINREGLRDIEHTYVKPDGVFRILILGDSFVEAMHVPLETTFTRVLQDQLNRDGGPRRFEVVGAGVSGYGTASELLYFEREGKRYQPDVVLLAFYPGNDVKNNSPVLEKALRPVYGPDGTLEHVAPISMPSAPHGWRGLLARLATYHYLRQVLLLRHPRLMQAMIRHGWLTAQATHQPAERDGVPVDYEVYAPALDGTWNDAWSRTQSLLQRLGGDVAATGARFALAVVCSRDQIYPDWWQEVLAGHPAMQTRQWNLDEPEARIASWCAQHGVPCLRLAPAFRAAAGTSAPLHYHQDGHWTVAGHRLAAVELADFLKRERLVPIPATGVSNEIH